MTTVGEGERLKLPGWVRRRPELTPPLELGTSARAEGPYRAALYGFGAIVIGEVLASKGDRPLGMGVVLTSLWLA